MCICFLKEILVFSFTDISNCVCLGEGGYLYNFGDSVAVVFKSIVVESEWCDFLLSDLVMKFAFYCINF
jgi:hypothetical protein